jgi:uncharacterized membrane protein YeaQ/YmgE (transglycosylase-associated protein family)
MGIITTLIGGLIIGLLGKFFAPGDRDNIPLWLVVICGIGGSMIGFFIYTAFGGDGSFGIDWTRWFVSIVCAAVLVMIAASIKGKAKA